MQKNEKAEYSQIAPGVTEEDFLSGRTGFALGFDSTNQTMVDLWSEGFQLTGPLDGPNELGRYCQARDQLAKHMWRSILAEYTAFGGAPNTHCCPICTGMTTPCAGGARPSLSWPPGPWPCARASWPSPLPASCRWTAS